MRGDGTQTCRLDPGGIPQRLRELSPTRSPPPHPTFRRRSPWMSFPNSRKLEISPSHGHLPALLLRSQWRLRAMFRLRPRKEMVGGLGPLLTRCFPV
jgi:hypothetical protein